MRYAMGLLGTLLLAVGAAAQSVVDPRLGVDDDSFLNRHAAALLAEAEQTFNTVPPQIPEPRERRLALMVLDGVLHDVYAPARPPVQEYFHRRIERAVAEMEGTRVEEGAVIWKLYNHGFVVRTASVTLAFDVQRGTRGFRYEAPGSGRTVVPTPGFPYPEALADRIVKQCDVLFISHKHGDHADPYVAQAFLDAGKPVVAPEEVFGDTPLQARVTHMKREAHTVQPLPIQDGARELKVVVYPGQQYQDSGIPNNVALVYTPEGMTFAHNGDQVNDPYPEYQQDFEWIDKVKEHHKVDVLMTNNWTNDVLRMARGFNPKLVIPGHENEMGHPTWDRVPYWGDEQYLKLNFTELKKEYPVLVMAWGESYRYKP